jgi:glycerate kinase
MKIVIAPDSFKESLSAKAVANCIQQGFRHVFPDADYHLLPLADGGEGTVDVLLQGLKGNKRKSSVTDPLGRVMTAEWALLDGGQTALIEIAAASGLDLVATDERNPMVTSTFGTGQLIKEALDHGVNKILIGLGGSATNDGGAGIVQALGGKLLDDQGEPIPLGGAALHQLDSMDLSEMHPRCGCVEFILACDVANPLCGEHGASQIFGPQKGATSNQIERLDKALLHFAHKCEPILGVNHHCSQSFGAAGGAPLGLSLIGHITIKAGIEMILDVLEADNILCDADLVITGEGQMDNQTLQGKTPYGIAKRAKARGIPVIGIAGSLGRHIDELHPMIDAVFDTVRAPQTLQQVLSEAEGNVIRTAKNIAMVLALGKQI